MKAGLEGCLPHIDITAAWRTSLTEDGWKLSIPAACQRFGDDVDVGSWVAVVMELQGAWCWHECAGLKTKALQMKVMRGKVLDN